MHTFIYLVLAAIIYLLLADRTDRAADRELKNRQPDASNLGLVEDFDVRPDLGPRYGRLLHHQSRRASASQKSVDPVAPKQPA